MLKTAVQHELAVTTSLQRLPHPYNPQNTVTTSSNRVIRDSFQHKIGSIVVFNRSAARFNIDLCHLLYIRAMKYQSISAWFVQIDRCGKVPVAANRHFGRSIRWRSRWVSPQCGRARDASAATPLAPASLVGNFMFEVKLYLSYIWSILLNDYFNRLSHRIFRVNFCRKQDQFRYHKIHCVRQDAFKVKSRFQFEVWYHWLLAIVYIEAHTNITFPEKINCQSQF